MSTEKSTQATPKKSTGKMILIVILVVIVLLAMRLVSYRNTMIGSQESIANLERQVQNMYERRADLIPQLSAVVKRYAEYEGGVFTGVAALRSQSANLDQLTQMVQNGNIQGSEFATLLASTMGGLKVSLEAYPQLKADTQFNNLFVEIEGSENRIRTAIKDYNDAIVPYNTKTRQFPTGVIGQLFGIKPYAGITPEEGKDVKAVPNIDELLN